MEEQAADTEADGQGDEARVMEADELYHDAVVLVLKFGRGSTSHLQRRLRIGYGRAAGLLDRMEQEGIVGPANGVELRKVLRSPIKFEELWKS